MEIVQLPTGSCLEIIKLKSRLTSLWTGREAREI
jgi:hypothetical protein